jgi:hypothetical protein
MKNKLKRSGLIIQLVTVTIAALFGSGCSTIVNKNMRQLGVVSQVPGTQIRADNGRGKGEWKSTPTIIDLNTLFDRKKLILIEARTQDGHTASAYVGWNKRIGAELTGAVGLSVAFGVVGPASLLVDELSGASWFPVKDSIQFTPADFGMSPYLQQPVYQQPAPTPAPIIIKVPEAAPATQPKVIYVPTTVKLGGDTYNNDGQTSRVYTFDDSKLQQMTKLPHEKATVTIIGTNRK